MFLVAWYWVLAAAMVPVTIWVQYTLVGAAGEPFNYSALERVLIAGRVLWFYLGKLVFPYPLIFCYDKWPIDAGAWWQYLYPGGVVAALAVLVVLRRRLGVGPLVGALVFAIMLSPALGFVNVYWHRFYFVADHMQYLACVGLIVPAVAGAAAAARRLGPGARPASYAVAAVLVGLLGVLTWQQCGIYQDAETVWNDTLSKNPDSWMALNNRGCVYSNKKDYDRAIRDFDQVIHLKPDYAEAYYNRGIAYGGKGQYDVAIRDYDKAIELKPDYAVAYNNRGIAYGGKGQYEAAIKDFDKAIDLKPDYAEAYNNRGNFLDGTGQYEAAIKDYDKAIGLKPDYAEAYNNRGNVLDSKGQYEAAIKDYDKAIGLKPDYAEAYNNRGIAYGGTGQYEAAIKDYDKAIDLKPDYAVANNNRGIAHYGEGLYDVAIEDFDKALELKPDFAEAYYNRAVAHCQMKTYDKAWADVKMCRRLGRPPNPEFIEYLTSVSGRSE